MNGDKSIQLSDAADVIRDLIAVLMIDIGRDEALERAGEWLLKFGDLELMEKTDESSDYNS